MQKREKHENEIARGRSWSVSMDLRVLIDLCFALLCAASVVRIAAAADSQEEFTVPLDQMVWVEVVPDKGKHPKFKTWIHPSPKDVTTVCALQLSVAQWRQDTVDVRHSAAHFDNCALDQGVQFVHEMLRLADAEVTRKQYGSAMFDLGAALHAVQDFYAHTNYVEILARGSESFESLQIVPVWSDSAQAKVNALKSQGLLSGVFSLSDQKLCPAGSPEHEDLAKDSATFNILSKQIVPQWGNRSHFTAALDLATKASEAFLLYAYQRWPDLAKNCGTQLGYVAPADRRTTEMRP